MVRYNSSGRLDNTFNGTGIVTESGVFGAYGLTVQSDGKIVFTGYQERVGGTGGTEYDIVVVRYNADGSRDTTFGGTGKVTTDFRPGSRNEDEVGWALAIQSDQKIVVAGFGNITNDYDFAVVRYLPNGMLDTTFNGQGWVVAPAIAGSHERASGLALQNDQKIVITGQVTYLSNAVPTYAMARYRTDGSLDTTFNGTGLVASGGQDVVIQNDGKIVTARNSYAGSFLMRFLASGAEISVEQPVNTVLSDGGSVPFGIVANGANADLAFTIKSLGDVNLTGLGITVDGANAGEFTVTASPTAPVFPGGSTTFTVRFAPVSSGVKSAALHIANNDGNENPFDIQLTGNGLNVGNVDPFFNLNVTGSYVQAIAVLPQQLVNGQLDATMAIGGNFTAISGQPRTNMAWLYANGSVSTFHFIPNAGPNGDIAGLAVQTNVNTLLAGGFTSVSGQARNRIARLDYWGSVEATATFNPGSGANDFVYDVMLQPDGKILLGGEFTTVNGASRNRLARLNTSGTVENTTTFDPGTGANATVASVALQADGKVLLGGAFTSVNGQPRTRIARLNANGAVESSATFNPGTGTNGDIYCVAVQADGKILLGGDFTTVNGQARARIARLNADGTLEGTATFNPGTGADALVQSIALQANGKIVLGGEFANVNGQPRRGIARLNANGTVESTATFNPGTGADGSVSSVALQADGGILLGGSFATVDGQTRHLLARLFNEVAMQTLSFPTTSRVVWTRGGAAPEVEQVTFELLAADGYTWNPLGIGTRIAGAWELTGLSLSGQGQVRARGRTVGGAFNGSTGFIEQVGAFDFLTQTPTLAAPATNATIASPVSIAFSLPEAALPGSVKLTFHDGVTPRVLTLTAGPETGQEAAGAHAFSFDIANPLASPELASGPAIPVGTYTVSLSYQDVLGNPAASSATVTNVRIFTPVRLWKLATLGNADAPDLGDPDLDGLLTLTEYGLNLLPQTSNGAPFVVTRFTYPEGQRLRVFIQRDPAHNDVTVEVQGGSGPGGPWGTLATSTLGSLFSGPGYVGGDSMSASIKTVEIRDTVNLGAASQRFLRVKVTH